MLYQQLTMKWMKLWVKLPENQEKRVFFFFKLQQVRVFFHQDSVACKPRNSVFPSKQGNRQKYLEGPMVAMESPLELWSLTDFTLVSQFLQLRSSDPTPPRYTRCAPELWPGAPCVYHLLPSPRQNSSQIEYPFPPLCRWRPALPF